MRSKAPDPPPASEAVRAPQETADDIDALLGRTGDDYDEQTVRVSAEQLLERAADLESQQLEREAIETDVAGGEAVPEARDVLETMELPSSVAPAPFPEAPGLDGRAVPPAAPGTPPAAPGAPPFDQARTTASVDPAVQGLNLPPPRKEQAHGAWTGATSSPLRDESASSAMNPLDEPDLSDITRPRAKVGLGILSSQRVRVLGALVPLWLAVLAFISCGFFAGWLAARPWSSSPDQDERASELEDKPAADTTKGQRAESTEEADSESEAEGLLARAASGDATAMYKLFHKEPGELTITEVLALARGKRERKKEEAQIFVRTLSDLKTDPDEQTVYKLLEFAEDKDTARLALEAIARLPGPTGPDLLYEIWTSTPNRTDSTELAELLVYSKQVRPKASDALGVALDLRVAASCEERKIIIARAIESADKRSLHLLAKLKYETGCGEYKREDCNPCLRSDSSLDDALKAAAKRVPPKY